MISSKPAGLKYKETALCQTYYAGRGKKQKQSLLSIECVLYALLNTKYGATTKIFEIPTTICFKPRILMKIKNISIDEKQHCTLDFPDSFDV